MDGMVDLFGLLQKVKRALSIDDDDCSQDEYLHHLVNAGVHVALGRTGRTAIDDTVVTVVDGVEVVKYEQNNAMEDAIVKNVALKYDDLNAPIDHTIYFQFNDTPMI